MDMCKVVLRVTRLRWEHARYEYEITSRVLEGHLKGLSPGDNTLELSIEELKGALSGTGEIWTLIEVSGRHDDLRVTLRLLSDAIHESEVPKSVVVSGVDDPTSELIEDVEYGWY